MGRDHVFQILREAFPTLQETYGVKGLTLFGSVARDEARPGSDVDLAVEFLDRPTFRGFMGLKFELEDRLHCPVDVGTLDSLKPRLRTVVAREGIHVP